MLFSQYFLYFSFQKYNVSFCEFLWVYSVWDSHSFLNLQAYIFCQIWEVISHYFFESFLFSSDVINVRSFIIFLQVPQGLFICFKSIFSLLPTLDIFYCSILKLADSFHCALYPHIKAIHLVFYFYFLKIAFSVLL